MTDNHTYSFFGQSSSIILQSTSKADSFIFFRCIHKKPEGTWEKPSKGEGKVIKCSLEEIVMILQVLGKKKNKWSSYHSFKDNKTSISFKWEENNNTKLRINIGQYTKILSTAQVEIFKMLLKHILEEKIIYATHGNLSKENESRMDDSVSNFKQSEAITNDKLGQIKGMIKSETEKALFINLSSGKEVWIPKSGIKSNYILQNNMDQIFLIDSWILRKNNI